MCSKISEQWLWPCFYPSFESSILSALYLNLFAIKAVCKEKHNFHSELKFLNELNLITHISFGAQGQKTNIKKWFFVNETAQDYF